VNGSRDNIYIFSYGVLLRSIMQSKAYSFVVSMLYYFITMGCYFFHSSTVVFKSFSLHICSMQYGRLR
jgi:hypothetical protein